MKYYLAINRNELGFPSGSDSKESTYSTGNTGDMGSIPGLGRSPGGANGNPLQYSCQENPVDRGAWWATVHGITESDMTEQLSTAQHTRSTGFPGGLVVKNPSSYQET